MVAEMAMNFYSDLEMSVDGLSSAAIWNFLYFSFGGRVASASAKL